MLQHITSRYAKEVIATITSKGQVTIPVAVRKHLGIGTNSKVAFVIEPEGEVKVTSPKYPTIESIRGAAGSLPKIMSWKEMKDVAYNDRLQTKYGKHK